ncbi:MAG: PQQ-dependent sugar dehydrogenase [Acidimicrobiales bacterium]
MLRKAMAVLAVAAVALGVISWNRSRTEDEAKRRFTCPESIGSRLPTVAEARAAGAPVAVALREVADVDKPVGVASRPGDEALYVVEKTGRVLRLAGGQAATLLDITGDVSTGTEQGLLGVAFSPDGARLYTNHTDRAGDTRVTEWTLGEAAPPARREMLFVDQPDRFHNGGALAFGPDGMLYAGLGDGGGRFDPDDNGQSLDSLLGKVLRIDPRPAGDRPYSVPADNPFAGRAGARPEIWAYGLRNPWRLSFDAETGDLWVADVGDGCFEELNLEKAGSGGGANYGWDRAEGEWVVDPPAPSGHAPPVYSYRRDGAFTCAVVGGYVYRGAAIPALRGWYVFGDLCHGHLLAWGGPGTGQPQRLGAKVNSLTSFGVDQAGELYATSLVGGVYQLVAGEGQLSEDQVERP